MLNKIILIILVFIFINSSVFPFTPGKIKTLFTKIKKAHDKKLILNTPSYIVINIPSYELFLHNQGVISKYNIRIGKQSKPTDIGNGVIVKKISNPVFRYTIGENTGEIITKSRIYDTPNGKLLKVIPMPYERMRSLEPMINGKRNGQMIHSTTNSETIGFAWSSGCIGLTIKDMLELYPKIILYTKIAIKYEVIKYTGKAIILYQDIYNLKPDLFTEIKQKIPPEKFMKLDPIKLKKLQDDYNMVKYVKTATVIPLRQLEL
ncbi:L,D-transpeptidase [bacterium]|nr:L,D-transpeptidase [bacterium]